MHSTQRFFFPTNVCLYSILKDKTNCIPLKKSGIGPLKSTETSCPYIFSVKQLTVSIMLTIKMFGILFNTFHFPLFPAEGIIL